MNGILNFGSRFFSAAALVLLMLGIASTCNVALADGTPDPDAFSGTCTGCGAAPACAINGTMDGCTGGCTAVPGGTCDSTCTCTLTARKCKCQ